MAGGGGRGRSQGKLGAAAPGDGSGGGGVSAGQGAVGEKISCDLLVVIHEGRGRPAWSDATGADHKKN